MKGSRAIGCALAAAALLLCALAPVAAGRPAPAAPQLLGSVSKLNEELALMGQGASGILPGGNRALAELRFRNHDGYTISVVAFGQTVALGVSRARVHESSAGGRRHKVRERVSTSTYLAHGRVTPSSIDASFGDRGRISVRFRPAGRAVHATRRAGCKHPSDLVLADTGVFEGDLRFEGEGGYTSVHVHQAPGRSVDFAALVACLVGLSRHGQATLPPATAPLGIRLPGLVAQLGGRGVPSVPTHPGTGPKSTTLVADDKGPLTRVAFAAQARGDGPPRFLAVDQASEGSLAVVRLVYARGGTASQLSFDRTLSSATASPPPPFSGGGVLQRGAHNAKSWSGSLAVSFLGAPHVQLTGPSFGAWLSQGF